MTRAYLVGSLALLGFALATARASAAEPEAVDRGKAALLGRGFIPAYWTKDAYDNVWRQWGDGRRPADYAAAVGERYGLHPAPYPNGGFPMGLRPASFLLKSGVAIDCLLCHGGSIAGQSYIGLGNCTSDTQALIEEMNAAGGKAKQTLRHSFCNVRGTGEVNVIITTFFSMRDPDLQFRKTPLDLGVRDNVCEDVPAWWLLKKKKTMYHTGSTSARSVRSIMQAMLSINPPEAFAREEPVFRDIQAYLLSLEPPKYPFPIDRELARKGEAVFTNTCARCHGTYGEHWTYPNKIVPLDTIGTDPARVDSNSAAFLKHYNSSWFAKESGTENGGYSMAHTDGYQAPPLDGIWATAPYLHNGSVPTVYHLLNSTTRPKIFTRSYRTDKEDYDLVKLGWKVQLLKSAPDPKAPAWERRKVYDTTQPGRGNSGHTFGDKLGEEDRLAVIEYLKTL
jgi:hypothetical protein